MLSSRPTRGPPLGLSGFACDAVGCLFQKKRFGLKFPGKFLTQPTMLTEFAFWRP
jgi:hypothetical protein